MSPTSAAAKVAILALALLSHAAQGSELNGTARLSVGAGADSNARRDYQQLGTRSDGFAYATALGHFDYLNRSTRAAGEYEIGARKFFQLSSEDVVVQSGNIEGALSLGSAWSIGLEGHAKDRRGGERDYSDLSGGPFLGFGTRALDLRFGTAVHRFVYRPDFPYSFKAVEAGLAGQYRLSRRHALLFGLDAGVRNYNGDARPNPKDASPLSTGRQDLTLLGTVGYRYRGPIALTFTYSFWEASSNSFGETTLRHRWALTGAAKLPGEITLLGQAALQITRYPDGPYPNPNIVLIEDDNHNSLVLKLLRPVLSELELELRVALYNDQLPQNQLTYHRLVGWMGFVWRL